MEKKMTIAQIDKNFQVTSNPGLKDFAFFDIREEPFSVYGLYNYKSEKEFKRLPDSIGLNVNEGVAMLYKNTAGGRVRFCTDSDSIAIKAVMNGVVLMPHFSLTGGTSFDLYVDFPELKTSRFKATFIPPVNIETGYESVINMGSSKLRYYTINFPTYTNVDSVYIGVKQGSVIGEGLKYSRDLPIVYYGSSITQGGCASRPGNVYNAQVSRRLDLDYINLGFSGSGRGEDNIVEYIASLPMCAFVSDYDHNSSTEALASTHLNLYKKVREAHPDIPYIMMSKCDLDGEYENNLNRRSMIFENYKSARDLGDRNVYYIDGPSVYRGPYEDSCTVDCIHPNDLGFTLMADALTAELKRAFTQDAMN